MSPGGLMRGGVLTHQSPGGMRGAVREAMDEAGSQRGWRGPACRGRAAQVGEARVGGDNRAQESTLYLKLASLPACLSGADVVSSATIRRGRGAVKGGFRLAFSHPAVETAATITKCLFRH